TPPTTPTPGHPRSPFSDMGGPRNGPPNPPTVRTAPAQPDRPSNPTRSGRRAEPWHPSIQAPGPPPAPLTRPWGPADTRAHTGGAHGTSARESTAFPDGSGGSRRDAGAGRAGGAGPEEGRQPSPLDSQDLRRAHQQGHRGQRAA